MSDEQTSAPTLRLKPRVRANESTADQPVAVEPNPLSQLTVPAAEPVAASNPESLKIRLKPRLNEVPASDQGTVQPVVGASSSAVETVAAVSPPVSTPASQEMLPTTVAESAPAAPTLRVRLQARPNPSENAAVTAAVPTAGPVETAVVVPAVVLAPAAEVPTPVMVAPVFQPTDPAVDSNKFKLKPTLAPAPAAPMMIGGMPVSSKPPVGIAPAVAPAAAPQLSSSKRSNRKPLIAALVVVGLAVGAYYGSDYLSSAATTAAPKLTAPAAELATSIKQSETLNKLATMPGEMIQKAKDSIAARREQEQSRVDGSAVGEVPAAAAKPVTPSSPTPAQIPAPAPAGNVAATATRSVAPGLTATMNIEATGEASPAFREFVANARISGIGATRVLINDRLVRVGEMAEASLGVRFDGYNRDTKQLRFSDRTGAHVVRRY